MENLLAGVKTHHDDESQGDAERPEVRSPQTDSDSPFEVIPEGEEVSEHNSATPRAVTSMEYDNQSLTYAR